MRLPMVIACLILIFPTCLCAEPLEQEAVRLCSEYSRIKKECYYKAAKGISPVQGMRSVKATGKNIPKKLVHMSCQEGYEAFARAGKLPSAAINQGMQASYAQCYNGYMERGRNAAAIRGVKDAYVMAQAFFSVESEKAVVTTEDLHEYGLKLAPEVTVNVIDGTFSGLRLSSKHNECHATYYIDAEGGITDALPPPSMDELFPVPAPAP